MVANHNIIAQNCNYKMRPQDSRTIVTGAMVLAGRPLTAAQLIRLTEPLGLSSSNLKSHLTRMVREGTVTRAGPARLAVYRPSPAQQMVIAGIDARLAETRHRTWDGKWLTLLLWLPRNRSNRNRLRAMLWFDGFRPLGAHAFARPAWPLPWAGHRARDYAAQFGGFCSVGRFIAGVEMLDSLYDLDGLDREARRVNAWIRRRTTRATSPRAAFALQMEVGGRVAQLIGHDPRLPPELWGRRRGIAQAIAAFRRFEERIAPHAQRFLDGCA